MRSATGQSNGRTRCAQGFTLIELILVLTLLAVAAAFIAPALRDFFRGRALDGEARRILALTHAAQSRSVSEGFPVWVWFDASHGMYGIEEEAQHDVADSKAAQFSVNDAVRLTLPHATPPVGFKRHLPAMRFMPDGSLDDSAPTTLLLQDTSGASVWLGQTRNRTGYEIHAGTP